MTLIAALPYRDGVVVAADSLESVGDYKVTVDKIRPLQCGDWWIIFGGAGNEAPLIDLLEHRLHVAVAKYSGSDVADAVRKVVLEFNRHEVAAHPAAPENKRVEAILCMKAPSARPRLFSISGSVVLESTECLLAGWDAALYKNVVKRTYSSDALVNQGVGLALELFRLAKDTCMWIGGDTKLFVVTETAIFEEAQDDIAIIEQRLAEVTKRLAAVLRSCPDTTVHPRLLDVQLDWLRHELIELHAEYLRLEGRKVVRHLPADYQGYQKLPYGALLLTGESGDPAEGGFALAVPDVPAQYGTPLTSQPPGPDGKPRPEAKWRTLALDDKWKMHGPTVKFKPIAVKAVEAAPPENTLKAPPPTYLEMQAE